MLDFKGEIENMEKAFMKLLEEELIKRDLLFEALNRSANEIVNKWA